MRNDNEQYCVTVRDVKEGQFDAIQRSIEKGSGGIHGVLSEALIESAVARAYCGYFPEIWQKAAVLLQGISKNHGFVDGNKRAATHAMMTLLSKSGYALVNDDPTEEQQKELEDVIVAVADSKMTLEELMNWIRVRLVPSERYKDVIFHS
ncbi:MAG: type II toxin-antitoxin system death-on-curing family toxin [Proteobacteria bacterium]|nr:type II toxin-antitoxin system death-on-curing family toxin [Pseudomonadota bacterium]